MQHFEENTFSDNWAIATKLIKDSQIFLQKSTDFPVNTIKFSCKNLHIF